MSEVYSTPGHDSPESQEVHVDILAQELQLEFVLMEMSSDTEIQAQTPNMQAQTFKIQVQTPKLQAPTHKEKCIHQTRYKSVFQDIRPAA